MTTEQLQCFMTLTNYMNYSAAAEHLFISQSTLSRYISAFEEELGAKLLIRSNNRVSLTAAGELMRERAPQVLEQLHALQVDCHALDDGISGKLHIGVPGDQQITPWVRRAIQRFRQSNPDVSVVFDSGTQLEQRSRMAEGKCDLMLTVLYQEADFAGLQTLVYAEDDPVLVVPVDFPGAQLESLELAALPEHFPDVRCFLTRSSSRYWQDLLARTLPAGAQMQLWPMAGDDRSMVLSVSAGEGMTLSNHWSSFSALPSVRCIRLEGDLPKLRLAAAYSAETAAPQLDSFVGCLRAECMGECGI